MVDQIRTPWDMWDYILDMYPELCTNYLDYLGTEKKHKLHKPQYYGSDTDIVDFICCNNLVGKPVQEILILWELR